MKKILSIFLKIFASILSILFIAIMAVVVILSSKPRKIKIINEYIATKFDTDLSGATILLRDGLYYNIPQFDMETPSVKISFDNLVLNLRLWDFFIGKINVKKAVLNNVFVETYGESEQRTLPKISYLEVQEFTINDLNINNNIKTQTAIVKLKKGNIDVEIDNGEFELKQYFDEKIDFTNLKANILLDNNTAIKTLNAKIDDMDFNMSLLYDNDEKELKFDLKNVPFADLNALWPNFLAKNTSRAWVLRHVIDGVSPHATATIKFKEGKLNSVNAEVRMTNVLLNYNNYFPEISAINGTAFFTEKDMLIKIDDGNILSSKVGKSSVAIDFTEMKKKVVIKAEIDGKFSDLFVHINKSNRINIENIVDGIMEDERTQTNLEIVVPIAKTSFNTTKIIAESTVKNKTNTLLKDEKEIFLTFVKNANENEFSGIVDVSRNTIEHFNFNKKENEELVLEYNCVIENGKTKIISIVSDNPILSFVASGFIDDLNVKNVKYNDSQYDLHYTPKRIIIKGKQINLANIKFNFDNKRKSNIKMIAKFDKISFGKNKELKNVDFSYDKKMNLQSDLLQIKNSEKITFNNFGILLDMLGITDKVIGGEGFINIKNNKGKFAIYNKIFINISEETKEDIIEDIINNSNYKGFLSDFVTDSTIKFDSIRGGVSYNKNILTFSDVLATNNFLNIEMTADGWLNTKIATTEINGLIVPFGFLNGFFYANKIPVIGKMIFGQKNAGFFSSKFVIYKKDKKDKIKIDIDKASTFLPGFLRNVF